MEAQGQAHRSLSVKSHITRLRKEINPKVSLNRCSIYV
jgi:hypothetical protein